MTTTKPPRGAIVRVAPPWQMDGYGADAYSGRRALELAEAEAVRMGVTG